MTRKQKKVLVRIIIAAVLTIGLSLVRIPVPSVRLALFLIPYLIIGYDILKKAALGIVHGEVFDENFLMAVATLGAIALGHADESTTLKHYIYNIEDSIETDNKVLNALDPQNYAKSDQRDQNIIPFTKIKRAGNLEKSTLSAL